MIKLVRIQSEDDISTVASLAEAIWNEYFPAIIGQAQVDYMLAKFQSKQAITAQVKAGYRYYLINTGSENAGYICLIAQESGNTMQISKFYIHKDWRGQGIAMQALIQIMAISHELGLSLLSLTVNKHNYPAIAVYKKLGFDTVDEVVADIGGGYVMDDYIMTRPITG
jgi:diamine N-acetyltransferase